MDNDEFLQTALSGFARTQRIRRLRLIIGGLLIFAAGVLLGAWMAYQPVHITFEVPAAAPPEASAPSDTIKA